MVPDRQKVRTDGRNGRTDGQTHGRRQNYIPPTLLGDKNGRHNVLRGLPDLAKENNRKLR